MNNVLATDSQTSKNVFRLLSSHNLFSASRIFFEIFLNVFIWKATEDLALLAWFNIAYLLSHNVTFSLFAGVAKRGRVHLPRAIALMGYSATYMVMFFLGEGAIHYVIPIAIAAGLFNGMYWISYQILRFDITSKENRGNYTGWEGSIKRTVNIIVPVMGGAIIAANFMGLGYSNLFLLGASMFLGALWLGNIPAPKDNKSAFHFFKTAKLLWKSPDIRRSMLAGTLGQFGRGGAIIRLVTPLLIFAVLGSELELGGWLSVFAFASVLSALIFGKFVRYQYYKLSILFGGLTYVGLIVILLLAPSFWIYVLFGTLVQTINVFVNIPQRVISENLVHSLGDETQHRAEYIVFRELINITVGRTASYALLLVVGGLAVIEMHLLMWLAVAAIVLELFLLLGIKTSSWGIE